MLPSAYPSVSDQPSGSPRAPRTNMFVIAELLSASATGKVKIRNMSTGGAMVEGPALPLPSAHCRILRGELELEGEIVWVAGNRAGIRFNGTAHVAQWLPNAGRSQTDVDQIVAAAKSGATFGDDPGGSPSVAAPAPLISRVVDSNQAASVADQLEDLADALSGDIDVVTRHMSKLQALDLAVQTLRKLADQR